MPLVKSRIKRLCPVAAESLIKPLQSVEEVTLFLSLSVTFCSTDTVSSGSVC